MSEPRPPAWNQLELTTCISKHIRALEVGKHRQRVIQQKPNVDNSTPKSFHYHRQLKRRLFRIGRHTETKKRAVGNLELLKHLVVVAQEPTHYKKDKEPPRIKWAQQAIQVS